MDPKPHPSRLEVTVMFEHTRVARDILHHAYRVLLPAAASGGSAPVAAPPDRPTKCVAQSRAEGRTP